MINCLQLNNFEPIIFLQHQHILT